MGSLEDEGRADKRFPSAFRGYAPARVDEHLDELYVRITQLELEVSQLSAALRTAEGERERLNDELRRVRGELETTRVALPEIEELHTRLAELRQEYAERVRAVERFLATAALELGERAQGRPAAPPRIGTPSAARREQRDGLAAPPTLEPSPPEPPSAETQPGAPDRPRVPVRTPAPSDATDPAGHAVPDPLRGAFQPPERSR